MTAQEYSIQELSQVSGLPRRTIHFYIQQEILPPPSGAGLAARYGEKHLLRLQLIPYFRRQGMRLDEIRSKFKDLTLERMREIAEASQIEMAKPLPLKSQSYTHYYLSAGITLVVMDSLGSDEREKLNQLLASARQIFQSEPDNQ